jgi:hypothetical protein
MVYTQSMSKLTNGILLFIGAPVVYVTGILFHFIPLVSYLEVFGDCSPVKNFEDKSIRISGEYSAICVDGLRRAIDPLGLIIAVLFASLFIAGLVLIGLHIYQRRLLRKMLAIVIDLVIASALLYSIFITFFYWLQYLLAKSPDCDATRNSSNDCDPVTYVPVTIGFSIISILLFIAIVMKTRRALANKKMSNNVSQT